MKAAVLVSQDAPLELWDVTSSALGVGHVYVRMLFTGICGKQLDEQDGRRGKDPYLPHLLGHEGTGVVEGVGPGVSKVKPGDHVVLHWMKSEGIESATPTFGGPNGAVNAGRITTFSEYTVVSENRLTRIDQDANMEVAALLGCAVTTGLGIVFNDADLKPGQSIAVFGVGGVGLNVVHGAHLVSAYPIVAVDISERKLERAASLGATHFVKADSTRLRDAVLEMEPTGYDVAVDTTGRSDVLATAFSVTSRTGRTVMAGVVNHKSPLTLDPFPLHFGQKLIGSHGGNTAPDTDIPHYLEMYGRGVLKLDEQITHRFPLSDINEAFEAVRQGQTGKCILSINQR